MCGIVAVIDSQPVKKTIIGGLKKIQYRGYDSAGVCFKSDLKLVTIKVKGSVAKLETELNGYDGEIAIGHTRWATHGQVCEKNAHPILSSDKNWAVVHNGIIENYKEIVDERTSEGECFFTDTDTEVISSLLSANDFEDNLRSVLWTCKQLKGSYAFCAINKSDNHVYAAKHKSPLYAFCDGKMSMFASDPICFPKGDYYKFEDDEICKMSKGKLEFFNFKGEKIKKTLQKYQNINSSADLNNFEHFMLKEIYETPDVLDRVCDVYEKLDLTALKKLKFSSVKLVGCGTAYHACLMGAEFFKRILNIDAEAVQASEFRYGKQIIGSHSLCVFVSQSGETADTIAALEKISKKKAKTLVITNVPHSTLSQMGDMHFSTCAGPEICVASTKAYCSQVVVLYLLTMALKSEKHFYQALRDVRKLSEQIQKFFINISPFAEEIAKHDKVFFIGKGIDYITALEGALKLKEISYINCNSFPAGELKHGVLALVDEGTPIIVVATDEKLYEKTMNSALEAKSRGGKLFVISSLLPQAYELKDFEMCMTLPKVPKLLRGVMAAIPLQLLSYKVCMIKGLNPDMPRNLAKSVTVE